MSSMSLRLITSRTSLIPNSQRSIGVAHISSNLIQSLTSVSPLSSAQGGSLSAFWQIHTRTHRTETRSTWTASTSAGSWLYRRKLWHGQLQQDLKTQRFQSAKRSIIQPSWHLSLTKKMRIQVCILTLDPYSDILKKKRLKRFLKKKQ